MTFADTIAKSQQLDRALTRAVKDGAMPEELGGKRLVGDLTGMFDDIRRAVAEAKQGVAAAGSELMEEVRGIKSIETAIRSETASVREFKTKMLGNAVAGENEGTPG